MKRIIYIIIAIIAVATPLQAQVQKEVEVTKEYIPTVATAEKPILKAVIADTTYINADVDYTITPLSINTQLQSKAIKPATVTYWEFNKPSLVQIKAGVGLPLNTLLQAHVSSQNGDIGYAAANVDHRGIYSDIESTLGDKVNATESLNSVALAGGLYFGRRTLEGEVSYSNDNYRRYAFEQLDSPKVNYQDVDVDLKFGDSFVDLSRFNYAFRASYSHFADKESYANNNTYVGADFGKDIALGRFMFGTNFRYIGGGSGSYSNETSQIYASIYDTYASWQIELGAHYYYDKIVAGEYVKPSSYLIPKILIKGYSDSMFSPFVEVGGSLTQNSFEQITHENPYVESGTAAKSSVVYNLALGFEKNNNSGSLNFKLYLGYDIELNNRYYQLNVIEEDSGEIVNNYFTLDLVRLNRGSVNAHLNYKPTPEFELNLDCHLYSYGAPQGTPYTNSLSKSVQSFGLKYAYRNFEIGLQTQYMSQREYSVIYLSQADDSSSTSDVVLPGVVNLAANIDWKLSDKISIFAQGDNLCSQELNPWVLYRGYGALFTAGVKINF